MLSGLTNTKKRKSTGSIPDPRQGDAKRPRKTLDTFFSPQVAATGTSRDDKGAKATVELNEEQNNVLRMVVNEEKNVFFTGAAGTGKSLLLRAIINALRKKHAKKPEVISVTASTGMAASNIGGMTIHSWGAVTPGMHNIDRQISCIKTCKPAHRRWKATKVLIIDEVSMVDGQLFDTLAALANSLRKKTAKPFGGIQLVITGDFFQLPPVTKSNTEPFFAFESDAWKKCIDHTVTLSRVYRQKDSQFVSLLNELRRGTISPSAHQTFSRLSRTLPPLPTGLLPTELYPLRAQVERANTTRLAALPGGPVTFAARDSGSSQRVLEQMVAPARLVLKPDAQVMLVKNVDEGLVNGCVGRVLGFFGVSCCVASVTPAEKAPGISATSSSAGPRPKSTAPPSTSGSAKNNGAVRNVRVGADGRTPIAFKTGRTIEEKENVGQKTSDLKGKGKGVRKDDELYPLVEFRTSQVVEIVLLIREEFRVEDNEGKLLARRVQVPLVLAWAMSIHKSQGQTIQHVKIDLGRVFEKGQSYVALSRAASMDGLQVLGFDAGKVKAHPKVIEWSLGLEKTAERKRISA
ncbi:ATP-dependent DNA helicase PIF1 [Sparassis crispa]|uniref:ATP-dependent DNA helicase PIF1 n=1 Tax=Sparassis crispa TaxID=139825 RepID=A0A401H636_9APHY|nr:ATP-dependent DNA helicase PIF1 [Sparassis crispa]GBE89851.1 ATP-dependent DNA helicase PIF1 [Sparassis crispa]